MIAALELQDFGWMVAALCAALAVLGIYMRPNAAQAVRRIEAKIDLILRHLQIEYKNPATDALSPEVRALADDPVKKIQAIALHRQQTGVGLKEAKDAVEAYIEGRG